MSILYIVLVLIVVGVALWLINTYIPMDVKIKKILNVAIVVLIVIWLLKVSGVWASMASARV
jgi:hypothetical protein